jgi:hypothetical protein
MPLIMGSRSRQSLVTLLSMNEAQAGHDEVKQSFEAGHDEVKQSLVMPLIMGEG